MAPRPAEELFVSQLPLIERVIRWVCARRGLRGVDAEDFGSVVKTRLIEREYEVLARFEGRSSLKTYLTTVINRLYLDFQVRRFGKWRPSAEARRLGSAAVRLEQLTIRDGLTFDEACGVLESDPRVSESRETLHDLSLKLPHRTPREPEPPEAGRASSATPSTDLERAERQALAARTFMVIRRSLGQLEARDQIVLRLQFQSGLTVADIARSLGLEQKGLYRRRDGILKRLRADLANAGIVAEDAHDLLATLDWDAAWDVESVGAVAEEAVVRPSQERGEER